MMDAGIAHMPAQMQDGWPVAPPAEHDLDPGVLAAIAPRFEAWTDANMHAILVVRHGVLVYEHYFAGDDWLWGLGPVGRVVFEATTKHDLRSVTKSVTALLVGIAIDRRQIPNVDAPVFLFFPECDDLRTPEKDAITVRHLLTMSSGLAWNEVVPWSDPENRERHMGAAADLPRYVLEQPLVNPPGRVYNYCGGGTELLGEILRRVSGSTLGERAKLDLFDPLGISDSQWLCYPTGRHAAASGLRLRPRDLAKIGQVALDRGVWRDRRVVSAAWAEESAAPHINGDGPFFYGYQWWLGRSLINRREIHWSAGFGYGGQRLFIVPELDIVAVCTAGRYESTLRCDVGSIVLNDHVLSAVRR